MSHLPTATPVVNGLGPERNPVFVHSSPRRLARLSSWRAAIRYMSSLTHAWTAVGIPALLGLAYVSALIVIKLPLLSLPYYGDAIGFQIPAAAEVQAHPFDPIPRSPEIPDTGHPPLAAFLFMLPWSVMGSEPLVTHTFMQCLSLLTVLFTYVVGRHLGGSAMGLGAALLVAVTPLFFIGSSLPQADTLVTGLTIICVYLVLTGRWVALAVLGSALVLAKETAALVMGVVLLWCVICHRSAGERGRRWRPLLWTTVPLVSLSLWFIFHWTQTGSYFTDVTDYRSGQTEIDLLVERLSQPWLLVKRFGIRVFQLAVTDFKWFGSVLIITAAISALAREMRRSSDLGSVRDACREYWTARHSTARLAGHLLLALLIAAHLTALAVAGFLNPRYLLPVMPAFFLFVASAAQLLFGSRLRYWAAIGAMVVLSIAALWEKGGRYGTPEDSYEYADIVRVHQQAASYLAEHYPDETVLTNYPGIFILRFPYLGYVKDPIRSQDVNTIDPGQVEAGDYDVAWFIPDDSGSDRLEDILRRVEPHLVRRFEVNGKWTAIYDLRAPGQDPGRWMSLPE